MLAVFNRENHGKPGNTCETYAKNNGNQIAGLTVGWKEGFTELTYHSAVIIGHPTC
jgi:hypothetical protein